MQSVDIEPNEEEKLEKLEDDFDKPFSPPLEITEHLPKDHPSLDTGIDAHEWYDEGASGAAETPAPRKRSILRYHPKRLLHHPKRLLRAVTRRVKPLVK